MLDALSLTSFSLPQWALIVFAVASIGANKTGLVGLNLISVAILVSIFGGKAAAGILMPFLMMADIFAITSYKDSVRWKEVFRLLPATIVGILAALFVGEIVSDGSFRIIIAIIIIGLLLVTVYNQYRKKPITFSSPWYPAIFIGLIGGFVAMIGNAAGPIITIYFIAQNLSKNEYIASRAWFFWIINILKVPLHIFVWQTISPQTLVFNLWLSPAIAVGALLGLWIVRRIPEKPYRIFILSVTFISAILMLL